MKHSTQFKVSSDAAGIVEDEGHRIQREYDRRRRKIPYAYYSLARPVNQYFRFQTTRALVRAVSQFRELPLLGLRIGEIGCGDGRWLLEFLHLGARPQDLFGLDLDTVALDVARERLPAAHLALADASDIPWPSGSMDIVSQITVFTSILDTAMRSRVAAEVMRVLKPGGLLLWCDFFINNPRNPNVRRVTHEEIKHLFPGCDIQVKRSLLARPIAAVLAQYSFSGCLLLERCGLLSTHYIGSIRTPTRDSNGAAQ